MVIGQSTFQSRASATSTTASPRFPSGTNPTHGSRSELPVDVDLLWLLYGVNPTIIIFIFVLYCLVCCIFIAIILSHNL